MKTLRPWVFFPPFLLLVAAIAANFLGSATLTVDDINVTKLPLFAAKLQQPTNAVSTYVRAHLSEATLQALTSYQGPNTSPEPLRTRLAQDLDAMIKGPAIGDAERFAGVTLQEGTRNLLAKNPQGRALARLNKLLLLDAYPQEIWQSRFLRGVDAVYNWVTRTFGWLVSLSALIIVVICALLFVSPFGRVVIGGPRAKPMLTKWQLFAIILTTNIAIGILFWGPVEPLTYFSHPPASMGIAPNSPAAATFAMSTVLLHWTWTPYAFASLVGVMFAFAFYNMKRPFTLGAPLAPLLGRHSVGAGGQAIDAICLYSLVLGMGGSLSAAMMMMGGGVNHVLHISGPPSKMTMGLIALAILATAIVAAVSGVKKGILYIANINTAFLAGFLLFIFLFGPTRFILSFATEGLGNLLSHYFEKVLFTGAAFQDPWPHSWTQMQFSGWFAWGPIMSVFLGRIGYGHSVRTFLIFNILLPALFTGLWMAILCGSLLHMEMFQNAGMVANLDKNGVEAVLYAFLEHFPLIRIVVPVFLFTAFISFVSTADSNLSAMSGISSAGISEETPESSTVIKIAWGATIGVVAWIMASSTHLKGVQMLSSLGGLPAMFLCLGVAFCAIRVMLNPARYDTFKDGYDRDGQPIGRRAESAPAAGRDDAARKRK
jgi:glycine betaine transporter